MDDEKTNRWWLASLCALSAMATLGVATFWGRLIVQAIYPPPRSICDDPFMALIAGPFFHFSFAVTSVLFLVLFLGRKQFKRLAMQWQTAIVCVLILGVLYCVRVYAIRTERLSRSMAQGSTQR